MATYLEVANMAPHAWCHPIFLAVQDNPKLATRHKQWRSGRLADLAFAIDGRLRGLQHLVRFADENLSALGRFLESDGSNVRLHLAREAAYVFSVSEEQAVERALVAIASFVREARSCFENLAEFRADFLVHYTGAQRGDKKAQYEALDKILGSPKWIGELQRLRGELTHGRYPWLAFKVRRRRTGKYEPVLVLNWRPGAIGPEDRVPLQTLRRIRLGLLAAVRRLVHVLQRSVRARRRK